MPHTPEPWFNMEYYGGAGDIRADITVKATPVARDVNPDDAARIVACVNACAGIDPSLVPDLLDLVALALPYVEEAESDPAYKAGAVAKLTKRIRATLALAKGGVK